MQVVKVKAPAHFAAFCVAINEPFLFQNGAFFLVQWRNTEAARTFCANNGVRARDLEEMTFTTADVFYSSGRFFEHTPETKRMEELEEASKIAHREGWDPCRYDMTEQERQALEAYRRELNEHGSVGTSREAFIEDYIANNF